MPLYRSRFEAAGIAPEDVGGTRDLERLPFTTGENFRDAYPDGLFGVSDADVRRIHASSGTTGKPKIVAYTESDLAVWYGVTERTLRAAGVRPGDTA